MLNIYESLEQNKRKSTLVVVLFAAFVAVVVYFLSRALSLYLTGSSSFPLSFLGIGLIISGISTWVSYYFSDRIITTISQAVPANRRDYFDFYTGVENLCLASGLPMPRLYLIKDTALNAFAAGRDPSHSILCVTSGLLSQLNRTELEGVVGHELSHIGNYDTRLMSLVTVMVGIITLLADWLFRISWFHSGERDRENNSSGGLILIVGFIMALISPLIARLIQMAISRRREFFADASSVKLTRQPSGLISALKKISIDSEPLEAANKATAHLYFSNPFHFDRNPQNLPGNRRINNLSNLFNTHPPIAERIKVLQQMS
jgi:heat shock protein HtpX